MVLTTREIAVLGILICCVPFQLWLSRLSSMSKEEQATKLQEILLESELSFQAWLSPAIWIVWFKELHRSLFVKDYSRWYPDDEDPMGECPAAEVLQAKYPKSYFATSVIPRTNRPSVVKWRIGQVIRHNKYGYIGVITGWDRTCRAPENWIKLNHGHDDWKTIPNYSVLVDIGHRAQPQTTYVVQEHIEIVKEQVQHPAITQYFDFYDGAQYIPQPWLRALYPLD